MLVKKKAEQAEIFTAKGMLTMEEWERHLNKLWADVKDEIVFDVLMSNLPRKNPINMMATSGSSWECIELYTISRYARINGKTTSGESCKW